MAKTKGKAPVKNKPKAKTKAKRKQKRTVTSGQYHVHATFNNTIITVTDSKGNALVSASSGGSGFRGGKKGTAYAAQIAGEKAINDAVAAYGIKKVDVYVKGIGLGRDAGIRALHAADVAVLSITDKTGVPHGGGRAKKMRRT